jgi:protoporphyrinogen oxidase
MRMCPQLTSAERHQWGQIRYQGIICASLLLKNSLSDFYITNITDSTLPYTAVIEMSALVDKNQFRGRALVYLPKYLNSDSPDFELSDARIQETFLAGIERMYPSFRREDVLCFQVSRVKHLLPIPTLNYSETLPAPTTSIPGLHIVNSAHIVNGTLNVNETVQLAETTAKRFSNETATTAPAAQVIEHEFAQTHS